MTSSVSTVPQLSQRENRIRAEARPECYLCGSAGEPLHQGLRDRINHAPGVWNISRCSNRSCGLMWLNPMPLEADIGEAYRTYYTHRSEQPAHDTKMRQIIDSPGRRSRLAGIFPAFRLWARAAESGYLASRYGYAIGVPMGKRLLGYGLYVQPLRIRNMARSVAYLKAAPGSRLLDVGCGDGKFVEHMRGLGWDAEGVEVDPRAAETAQKRGIKVQCGTLAKIGFEDQSFDAITVNHVLEHVHDPEGLLRECHRVLRPGGDIRVFVPNAGGLGHRHFGRNWGGLDPPRHLFQFTLQTLADFATRAGFVATVRSCSVIDRYLYRASFALSSDASLQDTFWSRLQLVAIDCRDWCGTMLGADWGEEIALLGTKA